MMQRNLKKIIPEIVAILFSLIIIIPFYMIVVNSFKETKDANKLGLTLSGVGIDTIFQNYSAVFKIANLGTAYKSSIIVTFASVVLIVITASMAGFIIQRRKQRIVSILNLIIIIGMTVPGSIVSTYFIIRQIGLSHSYLGICLAYAACSFPMAVFLYTGFYNSIARELDEAAIIDGCNSFELFFKIILPLLKPVTATVIIICAMSIWNDFAMSLFLLNSPKRFTVVLTTFSFYSQKKSDWNYLFADIVLISLPITILYVFMQKYIVSGLTAGSIKS